MEPSEDVNSDPFRGTIPTFAGASLTTKNTNEDRVILGFSLGFSYRASFICVTIRISNRCDFLYYVFISFFSSFPYMFRAFMGPSSGVIQAIVFMLPFGSCSALLIVCVRQRTGLWWRLRCTPKSPPKTSSLTHANDQKCTA